MNLCSSYHDEICYEGSKCPVCEIIDDKDRQISSLEDDISSLERHITDLEHQLAEIPST